MKDHGDAIGRQLDVEFEIVDAQLNRDVECGFGVLRSMSRRTAMGNYRRIPECPG
jgi:hypothetical protein